MKKLIVPTVVAACASAFAIGLHAQEMQPQKQSDTQSITVTGCVQKASDVLKRPAVATDVGMSDEYVLTRATLKVGASDAPQPETQPATPEPTGTSGSASPGKIYRVTGDQEAGLKAHLGHQVEIVGTFKHPADAQRETTAGTSGAASATPAEPPTAANTPEITIQSVRMLSETCGAQ